MVAAAGEQLPVRLLAVDSNGLLPLRAAEHAYPTAYAFRRFLQKTLPAQLAEPPAADPLARLPLLPPTPLPFAITYRWPAAEPRLLAGAADLLAALPLDHSVPPAPLTGGQAAAQQRLEQFLANKLHDYAEARNSPRPRCGQRPLPLPALRPHRCP